ncbi:MAG: hypothetical protein QM817_33065 [Archangium sp.]
MVRRLGPRFALVMWVLVLFPQPLDSLPFIGAMFDVGTKWLHDAVARGVLGLFGVELGPFAPSTDAPAEWFHLVVSLLVASVVAAVWASRTKSTDDTRLRSFTDGLLRLVLMAAMLTYGMAKVTQQQFPLPSSFDLAMPMGQMSPMGLLWRFMGTSPWYQRATGLIELLAGVLLISRRTSVAGALVAVAAMGNVVLLDCFFDVPVKLRAFCFLAMALWLSAPEAWRVLRQWFTAPEPESVTPKQVLRRRVVFGVVAGLVVIAIPLENLGATEDEEASPLRGQFMVTQQGADAKWVRAVSNGSSFFVERADGAWVGGVAQVDLTARTLALRTTESPRLDSELHFAEIAGGLSVSGTLGGESIELDLRRIEPGSSPLLTRGFHPWQVASYFR